MIFIEFDRFPNRYLIWSICKPIQICVAQPQEVQINTYNAELTLDTHSASIGTHSGDEGKNSLWNEQEYIGTQSCIIQYCG